MANKGRVVKHVSTVNTWSSSLLGNSGCQYRHASVLSHLRGGSWGIYVPVPTCGWLRAVLTQAEYAPTARKICFGQRIACVCIKELG